MHTFNVFIAQFLVHLSASTTFDRHVIVNFQHNRIDRVEECISCPLLVLEHFRTMISDKCCKVLSKVPIPLGYNMVVVFRDWNLCPFDDKVVEKRHCWSCSCDPALDLDTLRHRNSWDMISVT
jgi:hypothetical protein